MLLLDLMGFHTMVIHGFKLYASELANSSVLSSFSLNGMLCLTQTRLLVYRAARFTWMEPLNAHEFAEPCSGGRATAA